MHPHLHISFKWVRLKTVAKLDRVSRVCCLKIRKILYGHAMRGEERQGKVAKGDPIRYAPASAPYRMWKREAKRVSR